MDKSIEGHKVAIDNSAALLTGAEHGTEYGAITEVPPLILLLKARQTNINKALDLQNQDTEWKTTNATILKGKMAHVIVKFAHKCLPLARAANNPDLAGMLEHETAYITKATKDMALSNSRDMVKAMADNDTILTNILPADIVVMNKAIEAYDTARTETPRAIDSRRDEGTKVLIVEIKAAFEILQNIYDYVYGEFIDTKKTLVDLLNSAMTVEIEGVRHTGVEAMFVDIDKPAEDPNRMVEGAELTIEGRNITITSNIQGLAKHMIMKAGTYHVKVTKTGYKPLEAIITFKRGKIVRLDVEMAKDDSEQTGSIKQV